VGAPEGEAMICLSTLLDHLVCPSIRPAEGDSFFAVGLAMVDLMDAKLGGQDPEISAQLRTQIRAIAGNADFILPTEGGTIGDVANDLYTPGHKLDGDGFLAVHIPVWIWQPICSSLVSNDWRFIGLVWSVLKRFDAGKVKGVNVFVWDQAGNRMAVPFDVNAIGVFEEQAIAAKESAGVIFRARGGCIRCMLSNTCQAQQNLSVVLLPETRMREGQDQETQRLFGERVNLVSRLEVLDAHKKAIDKRLLALSKDGALYFPGFALKLPRRTRRTWDFGKAFAFLNKIGKWDVRMGKITGAAIAPVLDSLPRAMAESFTRDASTEEVLEPSISEALSHGTLAEKPSYFKGLGGLGKKGA
jgi:hypothetical protein